MLTCVLIDPLRLTYYSRCCTFRLKQFNINCDMLRQLSITSDTLHCIEHCSSKLQYQLDDLCGEIDSKWRCIVPVSGDFNVIVGLFVAVI